MTLQTSRYYTSCASSVSSTAKISLQKTFLFKLHGSLFSAGPSKLSSFSVLFFKATRMQECAADCASTLNMPLFACFGESSKDSSLYFEDMSLKSHGSMFSVGCGKVLSYS